MTSDRIIQKITLLQSLDSKNHIDMRYILKGVKGLNKNQIYYLLNKWVSSGIVEKKGEDKILPGGIQFKYKLSSDGKGLLQELSKHIQEKSIALNKSKISKTNRSNFKIKDFLKSITDDILQVLNDNNDNNEKLKRIQTIVSNELEAILKTNN